MQSPAHMIQVRDREGIMEQQGNSLRDLDSNRKAFDNPRMSTKIKGDEGHF